MRKATLMLAAAGLLLAGQANADFSATFTGTTDYDFRGVSQNADDPAFQFSLDVEAESGFYAGVWGSPVDFGDCCGEDWELDWYAGFVAGETIEFDVGYVYYSYPGADGLNYPEVYIGGAYYGGDDVWDVNVYHWLSWDWFGYDEYGHYSEANFNYALPFWDLGLSLHVGRTWGDGPDDFSDDSGIEEYTDYSVGLNRSFGNFDVDLRYVDTDLDGDFEVTSGVGRNDDRVVFSVSTTLPWGE